MGYLLSESLNSHQRATWVYHHRDQMDSARYQELLAKDAELKALLEALEKEKVARDPNYVLPALAQNPDLQYSKDFVTAAYNPVPVATQTPTVSDGGRVCWKRLLPWWLLQRWPWPSLTSVR